MDDNILEIIIHLFEHYAREDTDGDISSVDIARVLKHSGCSLGEIRQALTWLEGFTRLPQYREVMQVPDRAELRIFSQPECEKITPKARGFLIQLITEGYIDGIVMEMILDRAMALNVEVIDEAQMRWICFMVYVNQMSDAGKPEMVELFGERVFKRAETVVYH